MHELCWTYYIYYTSDGEVYAYTDDKQLGGKFYSERSHKLFYSKKVKLKSEDIQELYDLYPESVLKIVTLSGVSLAVTIMEQITVDQYIAQTEIVTLPLLAKVNPVIFTDKIQEALRVVGYVDAYNHYNNGSINTIELDPLLVFVHLYKNTLNWSKGSGILESISILLNRS